MRSDIKWRILAQGSKKMKRKSFLSLVMITMAILFLAFVHLFSLNDQKAKLISTNVQPLSIALTDFRPPLSSSRVSEKVLLPQDAPDSTMHRQYENESPINRGIEQILKNFKLSSSTFILGQIAAQHHVPDQPDIFMTSDEQFYQFLMQTFSNNVPNKDDGVQHG